jgi:hypothetical protein
MVGQIPSLVRQIALSRTPLGVQHGDGRPATGGVRFARPPANFCDPYRGRRRRLRRRASREPGLFDWTRPQTAGETADGAVIQVRPRHLVASTSPPASAQNLSFLLSRPQAGGVRFARPPANFCNPCRGDGRDGVAVLCGSPGLWIERRRRPHGKSADGAVLQVGGVVRRTGFPTCSSQWRGGDRLRVSGKPFAGTCPERGYRNEPGVERSDTPGYPPPRRAPAP